MVQGTLIADESGEAKQGTGGCLGRQDGFARGGIHGEGDLSLMEDVKAGRGVALMEENVICATGDFDGPFIECLDELRIGDECRRVQLH
jgi:hypothetical protein